MFCSLPCFYQYQSNKQRLEVKCIVCGEIFVTTKGKQRAKDLKYCSKKCSDTRFQPSGELLEVVNMLKSGMSVTEVCKVTGRRRDGVKHLQAKYCPEMVVPFTPAAFIECQICGKPKIPNGTRNCQDCNTRKSRYKYKQLVADAYGGKCACCGESELAFLTIDHIHNDGAAHRREMGAAVKDMWRYVRQNNFPKDRFQLLCYNCNCAKQYNGGCPHKQTQN